MFLAYLFLDYSYECSSLLRNYATYHTSRPFPSMWLCGGFIVIELLKCCFLFVWLVCLLITSIVISAPTITLIAICKGLRILKKQKISKLLGYLDSTKTYLWWAWTTLKKQNKASISVKIEKIKEWAAYDIEVIYHATPLRVMSFIAYLIFVIALTIYIHPQWVL